jgi:hypothetical protein
VACHRGKQLGLENMEDKLRLSAIDCRHYYQLGMVIDNENDYNELGIDTTIKRSVGPIEDSVNNNLSELDETSSKISVDHMSECGSEDVEKFSDDVVMKERIQDDYRSQPILNLAEELKLHDFYNVRYFKSDHYGRLPCP